MDKLIPGIPRIAQFIGDKSYLTPFVGSLWAATQGLGKPYSYAELLAVSGAGNRLAWLPGTWNGGNCDILSCEDEPFAPHRRTLRAIGFEGRVRMTREMAGVVPDATEAEAREDITASIDAGMPVIALGVIGPPECCVVSGYENDGERLVGWNYFQADEGFEADKPFVKADWFGNLYGYILLRETGEIPPARETALATFRAVADHARHADVRGSKVGLAAFAAMLEQLETTPDFSDLPNLLPGIEELWGDDPWVNTQQGRFFVYCDALCQIHERGVALPYYEKLRDEFPEWADELNVAIPAWRECAKYGGFLWNHLSMGPEGYAKFATVPVRKILTEEGRRSMAKDEEAIRAIERLLAKEA